MLNMKRMTAVGSVLALLLIAACAQVEEAAPAGDKCADSLTRCDDENDCTFDDCDPATGVCLYANASDGTSCEFGGEAYTCASGLCGFSAAAASFCEDFEAICGFGTTGRFATETECRQTYDASSSAKQDCIEQHLGFASASDPETHCPHATGESPCDL